MKLSGLAHVIYNTMAPIEIGEANAEIMAQEVIDWFSKLEAPAIKELKSALEPMVPYKIDPLEFCRAAHEVKDEHIQKALAILTNSLFLAPEMNNE